MLAQYNSYFCSNLQISSIFYEFFLWVLGVATHSGVLLLLPIGGGPSELKAKRKKSPFPVDRSNDYILANRNFFFSLLISKNYINFLPTKI